MLNGRAKMIRIHFGEDDRWEGKPLYEAIGEANNRHRRPASLGRLVERLMLLDAVLADRRYGWLGTERDKRAYFRAALVEYDLKGKETHRSSEFVWTKEYNGSNEGHLATGVFWAAADGKWPSRAESFSAISST